MSNDYFTIRDLNVFTFMDVTVNKCFGRTQNIYSGCGFFLEFGPCFNNLWINPMKIKHVFVKPLGMQYIPPKVWWFFAYVFGGPVIRNQWLNDPHSSDQNDSPSIMAAAARKSQNHLRLWTFWATKPEVSFCCFDRVGKKRWGFLGVLLCADVWKMSCGHGIKQHRDH